MDNLFQCAACGRVADVNEWLLEPDPQMEQLTDRMRCECGSTDVGALPASEAAYARGRRIGQRSPNRLHDAESDKLPVPQSPDTPTAHAADRAAQVAMWLFLHDVNKEDPDA